MKVIGYIRVSTDKQDLEKQTHLLLDYAQKHKMLIDEFIQVEISSRKNSKERRIDELLSKAEREYISVRTKQGLAAAKARGKQLGRPKGSKNKERVLDPYKDEIKQYLRLGLNLAAIRKIINPQLEQPITYNSYKYFVQHDEALKPLWQGTPVLEEI